MKNGIAMRTKWLIPCHIVVGMVENLIPVGASQSPTSDEAMRTTAIGTRRKKRAKKTTSTMARGDTRYISVLTLD